MLEGTFTGTSALPSLAKEGWLRHQENDPVPLTAQTGWFVQTPRKNSHEQTTPSALTRGAFGPSFLMRGHSSFAKEGSSAFL
jgi:hypothetical protein